MLIELDKDMDGGFIGPVPEIKPQAGNSKMEYAVALFVVLISFI